MPGTPQGTGGSGATGSRRTRRGLGLVRVAGRSMRPTLEDGDLLLIRWAAPPRPGAVVVVEMPGGRGPGVKRLIGPAPDGEPGWWVERDAGEGADSWSFGAVADDALLARVLLRLGPRPGRVPGAPRGR